MWDLWGDLVNDLGDPDGTTTTEEIFAGLLKAGPDIPGAYDEAVVADDDDGNLNNGTPHICEINDAFGRHGLGPGGGQVSGAEVLVPLTSPPQFTPADVDTQFQFELQSTAPECFDAIPKKGTLHYRINGGAEKQVSASISDTDMTASIPAQPLNTFVEYWFDGTDSKGNAFQAPFSGQVAPYTMFVGGVIKIGCEDFEASDGGYQHDLVSGDPGDGADDWTWGTPAGQGDDPAAAFSGSNAWGNDLGITIGGQTYDGLYQANKHNRLYSPSLDSKWYTDVFLQYRRWLNVEDGFCDQASITVDGDTVWSNFVADCYSNDDSQDREWISHSVDLKQEADQSTQVVLSWELNSDPGKQLGGWNVDDVCLYAPMTPDNRLAIVDFVTEDQGGPIGLSWTNPQ